jgi:SAM-dependent methyltransferase
MTPTCTICSTASPFLLKKDGYDLYRCPSCALVFVYPQPADTFLKEKVYSYESGYQSNKTGAFGKQPKDKKTLKILEMLAEQGKEGALLDVGCSNGEFMHFAERDGWNAYGVELNRRTAESARSNGLNVFNGFLHDAKYPHEFFDAIFLGDVIEHVTSPRDFIKECTRILKKDGVLVISTPNLDCFWSQSTFLLYRLFKIPWSSLTPPYHLHQFSVGNLYRLMRSFGCSQIDSLYLRPPRLMYELGSLHLVKRFKQDKLPFTFFYTVFAFALYAILYAIDGILSWIKSKDFSMVIFYKKD